MYASKRLNQVLQQAPKIPFDEHSKFVLISDCHRGNGSHSDNFLNNQNLFFAALTHYNEQNFTYIELGDGDELWENRDLEQIIMIHSDAYWLMSEFYKDNRLFLLYGNHDMVKKYKNYCAKRLHLFFNECKQMHCPLFPNIEIQEGLILYNTSINQTILLAHGHQGDLFNDIFWKLARFLSRYFWRRMELLSFHDPTNAAKNYKKKGRVERRLIHWVKQKNIILIAGHTHRPMFPKIGEPLYFNTGSCVHPRCITAIEIEKGCITLVKWTTLTKRDGALYVGREILEGPTPLKDFISL